MLQMACMCRGNWKSGLTRLRGPQIRQRLAGDPKRKGWGPHATKWYIYVSRSKERQSWSWLVAKDLVNFPWYLLHQSGLGLRLGSGELAKTWSGVPTCWVVKMLVECVYVDLLDCWMNWWTSWVWVSVLVVVKSGVINWVWHVGHDQSVMMAWKSVSWLVSVEGSPYSMIPEY